MATPGKIQDYANGLSSFGVPLIPHSYFKRTLWVGNTTGLPAGDGSSPTQPLSSLFGAQGALAKAHPTMGTLVRVLRGHADNVTAADMASDTGTNANIRIVGDGVGAARPTLTWTAATSTWLWDTAGIVCENLVFNFEPGAGTVSVAAPITISAASCGFINCGARTSTDSTNLATVPIALTNAADDCFLLGNRFYGATAGECTTMVDIAGADRLWMEDNVFAGATSSTGVGIVRFKATAATNITLKNNTYINRKAASAAAVTGVAGVTGVSKNELFHYLDNSSTTPWVTSTGSMAFDNAKVVNLAGENAMIATVVST